MQADADIIKKEIDQFAAFTDRTGGGYTRFSFSKEDYFAREYLADKLNKIGLQVSLDYGMGNVTGLRPGKDNSLPPVYLGSHLDAVQNGGKYDGVAGVVAAMEVLRIMQEKKLSTKRPVAIIAFNEEEGGRFGSSLLGSRWFAGRISQEELDSYTDFQGITLKDAREAMKPLTEKYPEEAEKPFPIKAYLELHGEQGPVLENEKKDLGIVDVINGCAFYQVNIEGMADHAGTTPMDMRKDSFAAAASIASQLYDYTEQFGREAVSTVGKVQVLPGASNIIPEKTSFSLDIRSISKDILQDISRYIKGYIEKKCTDKGLSYNIKETTYINPVPLSSSIGAVFAKHSKLNNLKVKTISSGAGHDAMVMASLAETGLVFVPSKGGRSHCPEEYSSALDIANGTNVLLQTALELSQQG